jgi:ABC-type sugar transport system permease subunit
MTTVVETSTPIRTAAASGQRSELQAERIRAARWFLVPMIVALIVVAGWPLYRTIYFSMTNASLTNLYGADFVWFDNYLRWTTLKSGKVLWGGTLADPAWWNALWNTLRFAFVSVILETILGTIQGTRPCAGCHSYSLGNPDNRFGENVVLDA